MKSLTMPQAMPVSKVDITLCLCAIALGGAIVFFNQVTPDEAAKGRIQDYLERIVGRMDSVSVQIADWYVQDINQ